MIVTHLWGQNPAYRLPDTSLNFESFYDFLFKSFGPSGGEGRIAEA